MSLIKKDASELRAFAEAVTGLRDNLKVCRSCFSLSENELCAVCADSKRDRAVICVAASYRDMLTIESANFFNGVYFLLGGTINPIEGVKPENLKVKALLEKIKKEKAKEIILALNPNLEGETTIMYLTKLIKEQERNIKITKLARGLAMGSELEYADELTMTNALKYRGEA